MAANKNPEAERIAASMVVGSYVTFGNYEQDNDFRNDSEAIEWLVLDVQGSKVLLLSRYGLDAQQYNTEWAGTTWEKSTIRSWLNDSFLNTAFTAEKQEAILTTVVYNNKSEGYSDWDTDGGSNTLDKVFLLSYAEANKYLGVTYGDDNNINSRITPTAYAQAQGARTTASYKTAGGTVTGWWWLRSPGVNEKYAAYVDHDGTLGDFNAVHVTTGCIRPALWIDLESGIF